MSRERSVALASLAVAAFRLADEQIWKLAMVAIGGIGAVVDYASF